MSVIKSGKLPILFAVISFTALLCLGGTAIDAQIPPPTTFTATNPTNGHEYAIFDVLNFDEARTIATAMGGYLASLPDAAERQWASGIFTAIDPYIGLSDENVPGNFAWESGELLGTTDWALNEPMPSFVPRYVRGIVNWFTDSSELAIEAMFEFEAGVVEVVPGLDAEVLGASVLLSWDPPPGSVATIIRNGAVVGAVDAPNNTLTDIPGPGGKHYVLVLETPAGVQLPGRVSVDVPDPFLRFFVPDQTAVRGTPVTGALHLDVEIDGAQGLSAGVCIDLSEVSVSPFALGSVFGTALPIPSLFDTSTNDADGIGVGIVFDLFGISTLAAGFDYEIATFSIESLTSGTVTTEFRPCNEIGTPRIFSTVVIDGASELPLLDSGFITFTDLEFLRGDCNFDGVVNIADPLYLGLRLFDATVNDYACREACEANGDGAIDIADMVTILSFLFASGDSPAAPFPDCGADPDPASAFDCALGPHCP